MKFNPMAVSYPALARRGLAASAAVALLSAGAGAQPAKDDIWDLNRWACSTITASSPAHPGSDVRNMFGFLFGVEPQNTLFKDSEPKGFVHFVEWRTVAPVTVDSFRLYASHDETPGHERAFDHFTLRAKTIGSETFDQLLYDADVAVPYEFAGMTGLLLDVTLASPVLAQEFRAEFTEFSDKAVSGPRVWELDAFGTPPSCPADVTENGCVDLFDFFGFVNLFNSQDPAADCDNSGVLSAFDFFCFVNQFNAGCG